MSSASASASAASALEINDPVFVHRDTTSSSSSAGVTPIKAGGKTLEGIVAYLGPVAFNKDTDWIGVRLTGSAVGLGKNDGTVKGQRYFDAPQSCGLFVKASAISKRNLTRLEELRLRRELKQQGSSSSSSSSSATPSSSSSSSTTGASSRTPASSRKSSISRIGGGGTTGIPKTPGSISTTKITPYKKSALPSSSFVSPKVTTTATSKTPKSTTSSRLDEIRQRRAQLKAETTTTTSTTTPSSVSVLEKETVPSSELQAQLAAMQQELSQAVEEKEQQSKQIHSLEQELHSAANSPSCDPIISIHDESQTAQLQTQLEEMERQLVEQQQTSQKAVDTLQTKFQQAEVELAAATSQVTGLTKELTDRDQRRERAQEDAHAHIHTSDAVHYKERAKLQGDVASLTRRIEQLELDKQEFEHQIEELVLDKEQLTEEKEHLEDQLEEVKLDSETAQMELEESKMELEIANSFGTSGGGTSGGNGNDGRSGMTPASSMDGEEGEDEGDGEGEEGAVAVGRRDAQQQAHADVAHNLSIQNARLREALIRLREQSAMEKMEVTRQLRSSEKQVEEATKLATEVETLRETQNECDEQICDLKDMVEQGSAYEIMVEELSDRLLSLEEELTSSLQTIRELEEAADITAEMEEVQTEEVKALNREMEDRETVIRNVEEAIKIQRKREEDFQRTVSNYRKSVETLKQEKSAILELHQGGEGENADLVSASQKALARAAQLVQDAAEMRKREAQAAIDRIESQVRMHLSERLESMLPASVTTAEVASIKGELLLSKVVGKSSLSLDGIARSFAKIIRARAWEWRSSNNTNKTNSNTKSDEAKEATEEEDVDVVVEEKILFLSDDQQQMAATMVHQSEVAHVAINVSGDLLWLLSAGQWPDVLSTEASSELGAIMGHSMNELDIVLGNVLNTLKEEGVLSPHQSNIGAFRQTVVTTMQTLKSHIEQDGESLVPMNWKPPALKLFRDASGAKYSCLGCYAAVACILSAGGPIKTKEDIAKSQELITVLKPLLRKLDQAASEAVKSCLRLAKLDILDETIVSSLSQAAEMWRTSSDDCLGNVYNMLLSEEGLTPESIGACEAATDEVVRVVSHFATVLRSANLTDAEDTKFHPFSPEIADVWEGVTMLARAIRSKDGDAEDVNYLVRARTIENNLEDAVESVPELSVATTKMSSLEKSLSLRSKELSMQNARLTDLEKMLARSNAQPSSRLVASQVTSEEVKSLKQENRYLTEAMDVLHRQVEEYENEIRVRDSKTPTKTRRHTMRSFTPESSSSRRDRSRSSSIEHLQDLVEEGTHVGAFEAALFRPALQAARKDAAQWKANATINTLLALPPLHVTTMDPLYRYGSGSGGDEEQKCAEENDADPVFQLTSALSAYQREVASVRIVDITKKGGSYISPRMQLHNTMMRKAAASEEVDKAAAVARHWLERRGAGVRVPTKDTTTTNIGQLQPQPQQPLVGRVKFAGSEPFQTIATSVTGEDLYRIQLNLGT